MAKEYTKAIKIQNSFVIYKNSLSEKELKDFIDCNDIFLKEEIADDYSIVYENESIYLYEWKKYKVRALGDTLFHEEDFMGIGEYGTDTFGSLQYKNCVGSAFFRNLEITILSKKMSKKECDNMIEIVNRYISNLSYDFNQTTYSKINRNRRERTDLNYHIYLLIMYALKTSSRQENILTNLEIIKNNPHRSMENVHRKEKIGFISNLTDDTMSEILSGESELVESAKINKLSRKFYKGGKYYVPKEVSQSDIRYSFDNNENRFVKFFLEFCLRTLERFQDYFLQKNDLLNKQQINENKYFIGKLKNELNNSFLKYVGEMSVLPVTSTVITKKDGYRQLYQMYVGLKAIPENASSDDAKEIIENKSLDVLYENYCFFCIADILCNIYGERIKQKRFKVFSDNFSKTLMKETYSNYFEFGPKNSLPEIKLHYNKNYAHGESYSKSYDPDISLEILGSTGKIERIYLFDSKFKSSVFGTIDEDGDETIVKLFKYDDISKMHAYKDAIKVAKGAYILYPGTENQIFYEDEKSKTEYIGVGAFCLRPGKEKDMNEIRTMILSVLK